MKNQNGKRYRIVYKAICKQEPLVSLMRKETEEVILSDGSTLKIPADAMNCADWMLENGKDATKLSLQEIQAQASVFLGFTGQRVDYQRKEGVASAAPAPEKARKEKIERALKPRQAKKRAKVAAEKSEKSERPKVEAEAPVPRRKKKAKRMEDPAPEATTAAPVAANGHRASSDNNDDALNGIILPAEGIQLTLRPPSGSKQRHLFVVKNSITANLISAMMMLEQFAKTPRGKRLHKQINDVCTEVAAWE